MKGLYPEVALSFGRSGDKLKPLILFKNDDEVMRELARGEKLKKNKPFT